MPDEMKPLFVKGVRRSIVDHPDEIATIMNYLRKLGNLRANAKMVELSWIQFSGKFFAGASWAPVNDDSLSQFATWLESGMDENDYYTVQEKYAEWEKSPNKSKELPMSSDN